MQQVLIVLSRLTVDQILKLYEGKPNGEVLANDSIELHLYYIAQQEYVIRTGNAVGAKAVSGVQGFLLPQSVCEAASKHTQMQSKLQTRSMQQVGGGGRQNTRQRSQLVPPAARKCYGCGETGHILANCPNLNDAEKVAKMQEVAAMAANAKGGGKGAGAKKGK